MIPGNGHRRDTELREAITSASEGPATLEAAAQEELMRLWGDLHAAVRDARDGCWSVGCENAAYRVAMLTRSLGRPTPWQQIPFELLESGLYQRFHELIGMTVEPPAPEWMAEERGRREAMEREFGAGRGGRAG
ncbi:hypothetical protein [Sphaerisporangium aureirubrum]|uniref:DUF222 domain-containing protein n=1 Tax=Sphaerisporangium aureirubrum TaxID=1544736 RepID=A0ABW1NDD3_9ACTN